MVPVVFASSAGIKAPSKELEPGKPAGTTSLYINIVIGLLPSEKLAKEGISLHRRESASTDEFDGTRIEFAPVAYKS